MKLLTNLQRRHYNILLLYISVDSEAILSFQRVNLGYLSESVREDNGNTEKYCTNLR